MFYNFDYFSPKFEEIAYARNTKDAKHSKRHNYISVQDIDTILMCMERFSGSANSNMLSKI